MKRYYICLFCLVMSLLAHYKITGTKGKDSQDIELSRKEVKDQIVKKYDIEKAMQNLTGSTWGLHSDSGHSTKHLAELQTYLKKYNNQSFYGALMFKTDCEAEFYTQTITLSDYYTYSEAAFTKKYEYIKDKQHPGLLHFLEKGTGKKHFSLQIVSPYLMVDTQRSTETEDTETLFFNISILENQQGNCLTENSLAGKKLVKYDFLEEYFLYKKMKKTETASKFEFKNLFYFMFNKKGKNLVNNYVSGFENSIKQEDESNGDVLSLYCSQAILLATSHDSAYKTSIIIKGKPNPVLYGNMNYYIACFGNDYCYTIYPYGFAVLHPKTKLDPETLSYFSKPGTALNFPSTLYVLVD